MGERPSKGVEVALISGIHGDELHGPHALARVNARLTKAARRSVLVEPFANPPALSARTRTAAPDHADMNRQFGAKATDGATSTRERAMALWDRIAHVDVLVDIHSGGRHEMIPHARLSGSGDRELPLISAMGLEYAVRYRRLPKGLLMTAGRRTGMASFGVEVGAGQEVRPELVELTVGAIWSLLAHLELVPGAKTSAETRLLDILGTRRATRDALFERSTAIGVEVEVGQRLGVLHDPYSGRQRDVVAPAAGLLVSALTSGPTIAGEKLVEVALPIV